MCTLEAACTPRQHMRIVGLVFLSMIGLATCPPAGAIAAHAYYANACINFDSRDDQITAASKQSLARLLELVDTPSSPTEAGDTRTGAIELQIVLRYEYGLSALNPDREAYLSFLTGELVKQRKIIDEIRKTQTSLKSVRHAHTISVMTFKRSDISNAAS